MTIGKAIVVAAALCTATLAAPIGEGWGQASKTRNHRVKKGDSLELLAAEYYGSRSHSIYIMKENGMTHPRALKPREVLKIPVSRTITTRPGDTFEGLAAQHLGDQRRAEFLATFNKLKLEDGLAAGQELLVPFHVIHTADRDVALSDISLSYFGNRSQTDVIRDYNFLEKSSVPNGTRVVVPVVTVRSIEAAPDQESQELAKKRSDEQAQAKERLERARPKWRRGHYREVVELLTEIDTDFLDSAQAIAVGVLLGSAYVATGDNVTAKTQFTRALERRKSIKLSRRSYSPKILAVWTEAGGEVDVEPEN